MIRIVVVELLLIIDINKTFYNRLTLISKIFLVILFAHRFFLDIFSIWKVLSRR